MKSHLFTLLLFCLGAVAAHAEPAGPTFRIISAFGSYTGLFYDQTAGSPKTAVAVNLNQGLSHRYPRPAGTKLELYRIVPPPPDSPAGTKPVRQVVVSATLPAGQPDCIVVTLPSSLDPLAPLQSHVIPGDADSHKAGTVKVINFSNLNAAVAVDEANRLVGAGATSLFKVRPGCVLLQAAVQQGEGWASAFRGERLLAASLRGYVFIFDYRVDPDYGPVPQPPPAVVKTFFEVSPDAAPQLARSS